MCDEQFEKIPAGTKQQLPPCLATNLAIPRRCWFLPTLRHASATRTVSHWRAESGSGTAGHSCAHVWQAVRRAGVPHLKKEQGLGMLLHLDFCFNGNRAGRSSSRRCVCQRPDARQIKGSSYSQAMSRNQTDIHATSIY